VIGQLLQLIFFSHGVNFFTNLLPSEALDCIKGTSLHNSPVQEKPWGFSPLESAAELSLEDQLLLLQVDFPLAPKYVYLSQRSDPRA